VLRSALLSSLTALAIVTLTPTAHSLQGGSYVEQERFPGTIAFLLPNTPKKTRCTAVHVAPLIFLTAAHCFDDYKNDGAIEFVASEMGLDKVPRVVTFTRKLVRAPVIQPDYYRIDGLWGRLKRKFFGENPDLALIKTIEDIEELSFAKVEPVDFHVGLPLLVGGFGPPDLSGGCGSVPCSIRMDSQKVTEVTKREINISANLTSGDDGGPAYAIRPGGKLVVGAINQNGSRLTIIDHAWYDANFIRLKEGRK
jgi:hypothetical protein